MPVLGDAIILGSGGATASIFVKGVAQTDTVTCVKGSKSYIGNWVAKANPASHGLPSGYTELTWIKSTGTQWIDTGVTPNQDTVMQYKFINHEVTGDVILGYYAGDDNTDFRLFNYQSKIYWDMYSQRTYGSSLSADILYEFELGNNYVKNVGASSNLITGTALSSFTGTSTIKINNYNNTSYSKNTSYYLKIYDGSTLVRNIIPCRRNSDSAIGMYDLVNGEFHGNSGSGAFLYGDEIPKYIYGKEFTRINEYGTYTIASSGYTSQNVLVDMATEFEIELEAS